VGGTVQVSVTDASWVVLGQMIAIQSAGGDPNSAASLKCTAINGNLITLQNMASPPFPPADTTQAGLLNKVSGIATDYVGGDNATHPIAVSADAGNIAALGSDKLISVPQSQLWSMRLRSFNAIGNPNFEVDQRNIFQGLNNPVNSAFILDRWSANKVITGAMTGNWNPLTENVVVPGTSFYVTKEFLRFSLLTQQASMAAGELYALSGVIEGSLLRELLGDVHSVSVLVRSTVAGLKFSLALLDGPTTTKSLVKLCTIPNANTWTLIQLGNLPVFPAGNFSLTPGNQGYSLRICLAAGSTYIAPAADTWQNGGPFLGAPGMSNFGASPVNSTFDIAFVQHEPGPVCSTLIDCPFTRNYDECLRYFQKTYQYAVLPGTVATAGIIAPIGISGLTSAYGAHRFHKPMAKAPTMTAYNYATGAANSVRDAQNVDHASAAFSTVSETGLYTCVFTTAMTTTTAVFVHYTADTGW
jgi:hypothetical protein